jgi:hypothetical protein
LTTAPAFNNQILKLRNEVGAIFGHKTSREFVEKVGEEIGKA